MRYGNVLANSLKVVADLVKCNALLDSFFAAFASVACYFITPFFLLVLFGFLDIITFAGKGFSTLDYYSS